MSSITDIADLCGQLEWSARWLFEQQGRWAAESNSDATTRHLATHSRFHGWHAQLWADALPDSPALDAPARVGAPPGWAERLVVGDEPTDDLGRLTLLYRALLPAHSVLLSHLEAACAPVTDGHVLRVAGFVRADVRSDLEGGLVLWSDALSHSLRVTPTPDASAAATLGQADLGFFRQGL